MKHRIDWPACVCLFAAVMAAAMVGMGTVCLITAEDPVPWCLLASGFLALGVVSSLAAGGGRR